MKLLKPNDLVDSDWFTLVHKQRMAKRVKNKNEISPELERLRKTIFRHSFGGLGNSFVSSSKKSPFKSR